MSSVYFITGATGFLGAECLHTVLTQDKNAKVYCLIRNTDLSAQMRLNHILDHFRLSAEKIRVIALEGDITLPHLGLNAETYQAVAQEVTHIIHSAASTQFDSAYAAIEKINRQGTQSVIKFAEFCKQHNPNFCVFGHVSTAYVAGLRENIVTEKDFGHDCGFKNTYEATKFAAELLVQKAMVNLPIIIFRPSIILMNPTNEYTHTNDTMQNVIKKLLNFKSFLATPALKNNFFDFVSVDYVAKSIYFLMQNKAAYSQVFHLTCGQGNELSFKQILELLHKNHQKYIVTLPALTWPYIRAILTSTQRGCDILQTFDGLFLYLIKRNPRFCALHTQSMLSQYSLPRYSSLELLQKTLAKCLSS